MDITNIVISNIMVTNFTNITNPITVTNEFIITNELTHIVEVMKIPTDWDVLIVTICGVILSAVLSFLLYKVSNNQYKLLRFQQVESGDKQKIQDFQKDVHAEFYKFENYIGEIKNNITKLCLSPNQLEVNTLIFQITNDDLNFFNRTDQEGIISFTSYVKMFEHSIFNENKTIYSYLKKLDKELFNLRINETSFKTTAWTNCSNNMLVLNRVEQYLKDFRESFRLIRSIAIKSSIILSSHNSKKDDFSDIEREYVILKQLTDKYNELQREQENSK